MPDNMCVPEGVTEEEERAAAEVELERLRRVDPPLEDDPLGNALIGAFGGLYTGLARGGTSLLAHTLRGSGAGWKLFKEVWGSPFEGMFD